jgi:hypothetical protein
MAYAAGVPTAKQLAVVSVEMNRLLTKNLKNPDSTKSF